MTVFQGFYQLVFGPLELLFELIYGVAYGIIGNAGAAIIPLSLCMNFLALPFYNRADAIQKEERAREARMAPGIDHIRSVFKADERYMMLQAFYRVNRYKPIYALRSSLPLLLEIPFFVAAYHFLSNLPDLQGAQFGVLTNLGLPDGLLAIGSLRINLLPILMTLINILSGTVYTKGMSKRDKAQLYIISAIFLILLYNSPSGLVFYWTLNQVFSLCKNLVYSTGNRKAVFSAIMSAMGMIVLAYAFVIYRVHDLNQLLIILIGAACKIPALLSLARKDTAPEGIQEVPEKPITLVFVLGGTFMAVLTGLLIPSSVVRSSPAEFVVIAAYRSPLLYVLSAFLLAAGTFIVWFGLFYYLANKRGKRVICAAVWIISVFAVTNYMLFGTDLGNLSAELKYDIDFVFTTRELLINAEVLIALGAVALVVWLKKRDVVRLLYPVLIAAVFCMSIYNISGIAARIPQIKALVERENGEKASFTLSRNGKNVIVFMLDRGVDAFVPYMFAEDPELEKQFDGFTWYPNTLSYSNKTNTGSPALFGGYEYTPRRINERSDVSLADKQNEALRIMPSLFDEAGYEVTVCDPPYAGYSTIPDLTIYDEYENVKAFNTGNGQFNEQPVLTAAMQALWKRNLFCFSIMKTAPLIFQGALYQGGVYFNPDYKDTVIYQIQQSFSFDGEIYSIGLTQEFMNAYSVLCALPDMTDISGGDGNTFLMMANDTTHNVILLQEPAYEPAMVVDNNAYEKAHPDRFTVDGRTMTIENMFQMKHYQCNMAAFKKLGRWFDYLRKEGVYDNTRIILVADHGRSLESFPDLLFDTGRVSGTYFNPEDVLCYNPLLMVKDFGETGFKTDRQFMTNADTALLATKELIESPRNPFTDNPLTDALKHEDEQWVFYTDYWDIESNNGNKFLPGLWYKLKGHDIFETKNWELWGLE